MFQSKEAVAYFVIFLLSSIIGTFGNICALVAVAMSPTLRRQNNAFLVSMSVADFVVTTILVPLILVQVYYEAWPLNNTSCKVFSYLLVYSSGNSLVTVTFMTLQCFVKVTKSADVFNRIFGQRQMIFYLFYIWIGSILLIIMPEYGFGQITFVPAYGICSYDPNDFNSWLYMTILMVGAGACLIPVPLAYYRVFRAVYNARRRVRNQPANGEQAATHQNNIPTLSKEELRITKISMLVTISVMVTWVPLCVCHVLEIVVPSAKYVYRPLAVLLYMNSSVNPFLYGWMNKHYGNVYRKIFYFCFHAEQSEENFVTSTAMQVID